MPTYTVHDAKTNLSKLIESAEKGEEVIIARGSKPAVRLVPLEQTPVPEGRRVFGSLKGLVELPDSFFDPLPEEELRAWEGEADLQAEPEKKP